MLHHELVAAGHAPETAATGLRALLLGVDAQHAASTSGAEALLAYIGEATPATVGRENVAVARSLATILSAP